MTTFWVLFMISTGSYNGGNITTYDHEFQTVTACEAVQKQLYDAQYGASGRATVLCIEVQREEEPAN